VQNAFEKTSMTSKKKKSRTETNSAMVPFSSRGPHGVNDMPHHRIQFSQTATSAVIFGSWCAFQ